MTIFRVDTLDPRSPSKNARRRAFSHALALFREAAKRVPAYKDFLKKHRVRPNSIETEADFELLPTIDKPSYISQYSLKELSWDGVLDDAKYVSTSSGSTGVPFFWPRGERHDQLAGDMTQHLFEDMFNASKGPTLFVDSFSLGTWIAGVEFFNAARWAAEHDTPVVTVTPGIDKIEVVRQIQKLAPLFSRVVLAGYPPFVKDIIEYGYEVGLDWKKIDLYFLFAGEAVSDRWRTWVLERVGRAPHDFTRSSNVYGMAESGMVAHETPLTHLLRAHLPLITPTLSPSIASERITGLYQFYPSARYFEATSTHALLLTTNAGLPLVRYSTRDDGGVIWPQELERLDTLDLTTRARRAKVDPRAWRLPFVYLFGRRDLSVSLYALMLYNENIKYALEHSRAYHRLSGLFTMKVVETRAMNQQLRLMVELAQNVHPSRDLEKLLVEDFIVRVAEVNSEYKKLHSAIGARARPRLELVPYGAIKTIRGKKHRWVER